MRFSNWSSIAGCAVLLAFAAGCSSTSSGSSSDNGAIFIAHYDDVMAGPLPSASPEVAS